jgi:hypothetical protein
MPILRHLSEYGVLSFAITAGRLFYTLLRRSIEKWVFVGIWVIAQVPTYAHITTNAQVDKLVLIVGGVAFLIWGHRINSAAILAFYDIKSKVYSDMTEPTHSRSFTLVVPVTLDEAIHNGSRRRR